MEMEKNTLVENNNQMGISDTRLKKLNDAHGLYSSNSIHSSYNSNKSRRRYGICLVSDVDECFSTEDLKINL
jgi:hypothetical protein